MHAVGKQFVDLGKYRCRAQGSQLAEAGGGIYAKAGRHIDAEKDAVSGCPQEAIIAIEAGKLQIGAQHIEGSACVRQFCLEGSNVLQGSFPGGFGVVKRLPGFGPAFVDGLYALKGSLGIGGLQARLGQVGFDPGQGRFLLADQGFSAVDLGILPQVVNLEEQVAPPDRIAQFDVDGEQLAGHLGEKGDDLLFRFYPADGDHPFDRHIVQFDVGAVAVGGCCGGPVGILATARREQGNEGQGGEQQAGGVDR